MPFKSERQRRWMHANKPNMARRWEKEAKRKERGTTPMAGKRRYTGREKRIAASNPSLSKGEVRKLANKRAKKYQANVARTGLKSGGKKGSIKREVFRYGDKSDVARLKQAKKTRTSTGKRGTSVVRKNAAVVKDINKKQGRTHRGEKLSALRRYSKGQAKQRAPKKPTIKSAVTNLEAHQRKVAADAARRRKVQGVYEVGQSRLRGRGVGVDRTVRAAAGIDGRRDGTRTRGR